MLTLVNVGGLLIIVWCVCDNGTILLSLFNIFFKILRRFTPQNDRVGFRLVILSGAQAKSKNLSIKNIIPRRYR